MSLLEASLGTSNRTEQVQALHELRLVIRSLQSV